MNQYKIIYERHETIWRASEVLVDTLNEAYILMGVLIFILASMSIYLIITNIRSIKKSNKLNKLIKIFLESHK